MIDIDIRFIKGVLVVTLEGKLNKKNVSSIKNNLISIIKNGGIKNLMFNLNECILEEDIDMFDECDKLIKDNNGKMYVCGLNSLVTKDYYSFSNIGNEFKYFEELNKC